MSYEEREAFVQIAQYFPLLLLVLPLITRRLPLLVAFIILMFATVFFSNLTVPDRPNLSLLDIDITSFWAAVALVIIFLLRAQQSVFALMRAIMAPLVLAEYFILEMSTITTWYVKNTFIYREGWGWHNGWVVWPLSHTLERLLSFIYLAMNKLPFLGRVTRILQLAVVAPIIFGMVFIPVSGLILYVGIVWWYLPYLREYPTVDIPEHLPPGFISQIKAARIRALRTMFQEHTAFIEFLSYFARKRAARNYTR